MSWDDTDEARKVYKFLKCGVLEPEDLTHNEVRLIRQYHPQVYHFVKWWLENRSEMIENGEWSEDHEPPERKQRINRYENGESIVEPFKDNED